MKTYVQHIFKSHYCKIIFIIIFFLSYFLIPKKLFHSWWILVAILFMFLFSLVITCIVRNVKEKVILAKTYKSSLIGVLATAIGLSALQVCGVGAPVCGATIGAGFLSALFPGIFMRFLDNFAIYILIASILLQIISLYFMNCFKKLNNKLENNC